MRIACDGTWYYRGTPVRRASLVRLFASMLRCDAAGEYFLVTRFQKCRICVDDVPFIATALSVHGDGARQSLQFTTNTGEQVMAGRTHPLCIAISKASGQPVPHLGMRDNLTARLSRSVYYELAALGDMRVTAGRVWLYIPSDGVLFKLGGDAP